MEKDLTKYVKVYNVLDKSICQETIDELQLLPWERHSFYNHRENKTFFYEDRLFVNFSESKNHEYLMQSVWNCLKVYVCEDLKFAWLDGWAGFTNIRYNKYETSGYMKEHCDHIHSIFDGERKGIPVFSIVGNLNDNYEGGEFVMWNDTKIDLNQGDILIFPSNFLYPHQVKPVIKGTRYTFVSWAY